MIKNMLHTLRNYLQDIQHFGPAVLGRMLTKTNVDGYSVAQTRFGKFHLCRVETDLRVLRQIFISREYDLDPIRFS